MFLILVPIREYNSLGEYCGPQTAASVFLIYQSSMPKQSIVQGKTNKDMLQDLNQSLCPCPHCDKQLRAQIGLISILINQSTKLMIQKEGDGHLCYVKNEPL